MNDKVKEDADHSATAFQTLIWPLCQPYCGGGDLLQMEGRKDKYGNKDPLADLLDIKAGIDGWQLHDDGMCGIASRVQKDKAWNSFTIRMSRESGAITEYEKRQIALAGGKWLLPYWTIQAYVQAWDGPVLSVGIAKTVDVINFIEHGLHKIRQVTEGGCATFAVCWWDAMKSAGYSVHVITPNFNQLPLTIEKPKEELVLEAKDIVGQWWD